MSLVHASCRNLNDESAQSVCRGDPDTHLDASELAKIEQQWRLLRDEFDVDARVLLVTPQPDQAIESFGIESVQALSEQNVCLGPTGLLMIVDGGSGRARVEVGYAREPHRSDALAGALTLQHLAALAAAANWICVRSCGTLRFR